MAQYIGRRVVPAHGGVWDKAKGYEELTIVLEKQSGDSYISRRPVPAGTVIGDGNYWMLHSLYSAQIAEAEKHLADAAADVKNRISESEQKVERELEATEQKVTDGLAATEKTVGQRTAAAEALTNSNKTELNTRMDAIEARQDANVSASTDTDADYAAEVVDARVGADSKKHGSLGEHLRAVGERAADNSCAIGWREAVLKEDYCLSMGNIGCPYGRVGEKVSFDDLSYWRYGTVDVTPGEAVYFKIHSTYHVNPEPYVLFVDSGGTILAREAIVSTLAGYQSFVLEVPENAAQAYVKACGANDSVAEGCRAGLFERYISIQESIEKNSLYISRQALMASARETEAYPCCYMEVRLERGKRYFIALSCENPEMKFSVCLVGERNIDVVNRIRQFTPAAADGWGLHFTAEEDDERAGYLAYFCKTKEEVNAEMVIASPSTVKKYVEASMGHGIAPLERKVKDISCTSILASPLVGETIGFAADGFDLTVSMPRRIFFNGYTQATVTRDLSDDERTARVPNNHYFLYDFTEGAFVVADEAARQGYQNDYVILMWTHYGIPKGQWERYYHKNMIAENAAAIARNAAALRECAGTLPDYYNADGWLDGKIAEIRRATRVLEGVSFAFITDIHVNANSMNSRYLLREVLRRTTVRDVFFGGDAVCAYGTREDCLGQAEAMIDYANYVTDRFYTVHGNHDFTIRTSAEEATGFTAQRDVTYDLIMRQREDAVSGLPGKCFYYVDNAVQKVRFLVVDAYEGIAGEGQPWGVSALVTQEQYDWLVDDALDAPGYTIIAFAHTHGDVGLDYYAASLVPVADLFRAMNNRKAFSYSGDGIEVEADYTGATSTVAAFICGHTHADSDHMGNGLLTITTTCDARYNDDPKWKRTNGTVTEQAFDVFTVNTSERKISTVRIGAGENREWSY